MEETLIVIMLKEKETGFFYKELCSISIGNMEEYLQNINGYIDDGKVVLNMLITTNRDVLDWEYNAILDIYEIDKIKEFANIISVEEVEDCFNPTWSVKFIYDEKQDEEELQDFILDLLEVHKRELLDTYEAIIEVQDEYMEQQ